MPFYAVAKGRKTGIFLTWDDCRKQVQDGFSKPIYKKFNTRGEAEEFIQDNTGNLASVINQSAKRISVNQSEKRSYYACADSRVGPAIFFSLNDCQKQVQGSGYKHQKFSNVQEAENFIFENRPKNEEKENVQNPEKKQKLEPEVKSEIEPPTRSNNLSEDLKNRFSGLHTFKCSETGFYKNEKGIVIAYTDGAAPSNGKRNASGIAIGRSGCGVFFNEEKQYSFYNPSAKLPDGNTNNFAEAHAIEEALVKALEFNLVALEIRTDSQYCIDSLEKWSKGWIRKAGVGGEWKNSKNEKIKHQEVFQNIINMRKKVKTSLVHVRGHRDDYGNNEADRLAVQGANSQPF